MGKGRRVKCKATGEYGNSNDFYKSSKGYFKSKEIYEDYERESECRKKIINILSELIGYQKGEPLPPVILTELKKLNFYKNQVILETIKQEYKTLLYYSQNKEFKSSFAKGRYLLAIIKNRIADVNQKYERRKKEESELLQKVQQDDNSYIDFDIPVQKQQNKNLGAFIEDEN